MNDASASDSFPVTLPAISCDPFDVVVSGGGVSGAMAGIAAARAGARVLVVERHAFMGGSLTAMGVGPMMTFHNRAGRQLVKGLPQEMVERLMKRGGSPGHIPDSTTYCSTVTPFDPEALKIELETMLTEAGGQALYHTPIAGVELEGDRIASLIVCGKGGMLRIRARTWIDASGDGDLAAMSGAPFSRGRDGDEATQPMTMNFRVGNVDTKAIRRYVEENPENFLFAHGREEGLKRIRTSPRISIAGFLKEWEEARANGEVDVPRDHVLFFETATPGEVVVNTSRMQGFDATDSFDVSRAEMIGRRQCQDIFRFLKARCAGFSDTFFIGTSTHVGVRESRHIRGLYLMTKEDVLEERDFPDTVAVGGYPIDIHSPEKAETNSTHLRADCAYRIPMRCLLVERPRNLVLVGRCLSATHEAAGAVRVSPIMMAVGQAGGTIAALAAAKCIDPAALDYAEVREKLLAAGACLT